MKQLLDKGGVLLDKCINTDKTEELAGWSNRKLVIKHSICSMELMSKRRTKEHIEELEERVGLIERELLRRLEEC